MNQRHKHADVIIAWAEGKEIEYRDPTRHHSGLWVECQHPGWYENFEYRIKPPPKKCRVALFRLSTEGTSTYTTFTDTQEEANSYEQHIRFVRWLTDWIEYEE